MTGRKAGEPDDGEVFKEAMHQGGQCLLSQVNIWQVDMSGGVNDRGQAPPSVIHDDPELGRLKGAIVKTLMMLHPAGV